MEDVHQTHVYKDYAQHYILNQYLTTKWNKSKFPRPCEGAASRNKQVLQEFFGWLIVLAF